MTSITFAKVGKTFGNAVAVIRDVNLSIGDGEFCVFLGPSGCGKSTLLRMIAGLETQFTGEIRIGGQRVNDIPAAQRQVAMVFQNYALYPHMSVRENMAFGLKQARRPRAEIDRTVNEAARILQIEPMLDRMPKALSGGQRQRVAIGRAIVRQPKVFLFDEPLSNLDAALRVHMRTEIGTLHRDFPAASMVYVTHDQTEAMALADKIVLLHAGEDMLAHGSIAQVGSPLDLYHRPRNLFVAGFLGSPTMNFLPGRLTAASGDTVHVRLASGDMLRVSAHARIIPADAPVTVGIRPEHLQAGGTGDEAAGLSGDVTMVEHFGEHSLVHLKTADNTTVIAKVPGAATPNSGAVRFTAPPDAIHLFGADGLALPRAA